MLTDKLKVKRNLQKFSKRNQVNQSSNQSYSVLSNSATGLRPCDCCKIATRNTEQTPVCFLYFVFKNQNFRLSDRFIFIERQKVLSVTRMSSSDTYFRHCTSLTPVECGNSKKNTVNFANSASMNAVAVFL